MNQRAGQFFFGVSNLQGPFRMAFDLQLSAAQSRQLHYRQKLSGLSVQPAAGIEITEAQLGKKTRNRLGKFAGKPGIPLPDFGSINGRLKLPSLCVPLFR